MTGLRFAYRPPNLMIGADLAHARRLLTCRQTMAFAWSSLWHDRSVSTLSEIPRPDEDA